MGDVLHGCLLVAFGNLDAVRKNVLDIIGDRNPLGLVANPDGKVRISRLLRFGQLSLWMMPNGNPRLNGWGCL